MLIKFEDTALNNLNDKGQSDIEILHQMFTVTQLMKQSSSQRINQYFQNHYNDLKIIVLRRDFIDLYPKIEALEKEWMLTLPAYDATGLKLSDKFIEDTLSSKNNKTIDDFHLSVRTLGEQSGNLHLRSLEKNKISQNEFVNQKTVYNILVSDVLDANKHLTTFRIKDDLTIASNDIINTKGLKAEKLWKPQVN